VSKLGTGLIAAAAAGLATAAVLLVNAATEGRRGFAIVGAVFVVGSILLLGAGIRIGQHRGWWRPPRGILAVLPPAYLLGILLPAVELITGRLTWVWALVLALAVLGSSTVLALLLGISEPDR
jgi:hypothetical protein